MARGVVVTYPNCPLASTVSVFGTVFAISGLYMLGSDLVSGIVMIAIGAACLLFAPVLAKRKRFKLWIKDLQSKGVLDKLSTSRDLCFQMYQANPMKKTVKVIAKYNPAVAEEIISGLNSK